MEQIGADEKMDLSSSLKPRKGGLRTLPFIILNESLEKVASYGILPNMIFYLKNDYHMKTPTAASILFAWSAISNTMAILGAFLSDSYMGRFRVILIGSISSFLGLTLLWLTAMIPELRPPSCESSIQVCNSATAAELAVLFFSFGLISIGAGCIRPCSIAFGADQLETKENSDNDRILDSYFHWFYASSGTSYVLAFSIIVYIQDNLGWKVGFGVPAMLMFLSALIFMVGSSCYIKVKPGKNLITGFAQVVVVAFKNRKLSVGPSNFDQYHHSCDSEILAPTDSLRWLNKACIVRDGEGDMNPDESASNSWTLCTVEQVESLKGLLRVIPMWSTGIVMVFCTNQGSFNTIQAKTMDRRIFGNFKIPAGSFVVVMTVTLTLWIAFYDRILVPLLSKYTGRPRGLSCKVRMGIGLLFACASTAVSTTIETIRRREAIEQGVENQPDAVISMSALWLVPAQALMGLANAFNAIGQLELFYTCFPKSMSSFALAIYTLELAVADLVGSLLVDVVDKLSSKGGKESWLSSNINKGHLNYYYGFITFLGLINYIYFLVCCSAYEPNKDQKPGALDVTEDEQFDYTELQSS